MRFDMMITPQACRRITGAVEALPDTRARERWGSWARQGAVNQTRTDVPYEIAAIALDALVVVRREIERQLGDDFLDENQQSDLLNDLGYVSAIETTLRSEGVGR
jgi:hypothetical protein